MNEEYYIDLIKGFFGNDIEKVKNLYILNKCISHFSNTDKMSEKEEICLIRRSFNYMLSHDKSKNFLEQKKNALINGDKKTQLGTLSEIIAYYCLQSIGLNVEYQKTSTDPTPDFFVESSQGEKMIIEVAHRGLCDEAIKKIEDANKKLSEVIKNNTDKSKRIFIGDPVDVRPFGYSNDSVTADAISKICSIKEKEHQFNEELPSVLWIDLGLDSIDKVETLYFPLNTWNKYLTSGHLWYAFYGKKGYPIYSDYPLDTREYEEYSSCYKRECRETMKHNGRFYNNSKLSGCIIRTKDTCIFYENPNAINPISDKLRELITFLPNFSIEKSLANFYPNMVNEQNEIYEKYIKSF